MISIISLILQGIGDGSQPLISRFYGEDNHRQLRSTQGLAYGFSLLLAFTSCLILYVSRSQIGILFGRSQSGGFCHPSDFSGLGALCRHFTHHHIRLLCVPTGSTLLSVDFYRTCADVGVYANSASAFWWADHDLVVYRICAHLMRSAGVWHGRFCEEKIPDGRKTI